MVNHGLVLQHRGKKRNGFQHPATHAKKPRCGFATALCMRLSAVHSGQREIELVARLNADDELVLRTALAHQRTVGGITRQTAIFGKRADFGIVGDLPGDGCADASGMQAAARAVWRWRAGRRLCCADAIIALVIFAADPRRTRTGRHLNAGRDIGKDIDIEIGDHTAVAADALTRFAANAQPIGRISFGKTAKLAAALDTRHALQIGGIAFVTRGNQLAGETHADRAIVQKRNRGAVVARGEPRALTLTAHGNDRCEAEFVLVIALVLRRAKTGAAEFQIPVARKPAIRMGIAHG
ncbi:hypothetical protein AT6N2_C1843 [Agrobacterium tumefaciens]|nr:hypothetical protein AT6N2_C1843 [Agrobacterium tumefaciens]